MIILYKVNILKQLEEYEIKKLENVIELVKENIQDNEMLYKNMNQNTDDKYLLYNLAREYDNKRRNLNRALLNPYFARIDFKANDVNEVEKIYIGKTNIFDEYLNVAVADWRAPISSIYYDGKLGGETEYKCPEGIIKGILNLKRQYDIQNASLINYNDIDITTNDQLLQDCLNENSDVRLKNIVSTIQSEQNKIIRANMFKPLIIQGVAGSGKTTVALHRIAYLVYTYEKSFNPEEFLIIAPNKFFLDYISNVLPDLGVDYVKQKTFEEFALEIIDQKIDIKNPNIELSKIVNEGKEKTKLIQRAATFKSSMEFKTLIEEYLTDLVKNLLQNKDFKISEFVVMKYDELQKILSDALKGNSIKDSIKILNNIMQKKLEDMSNILVGKITQKRKEKLDKINNDLNIEEQQKIRVQIFEETEYEINQLLKGGKKLVTDYIKNIKLKNVVEHYKNIMNDEQLLSKYCDKELSSYIITEFNNNFKKKNFEYEDLTAILYLQYKIFGFKEKISLKHIVIDEAQDYGEFQFFVLNQVLGNNKSITILGDIAQGIYSYRGTKDWEKVNNIIFNNEANIETLNNSYRTTFEIMTEANKILEKLQEKENINLANPISRHGDKVNYVKIDDFENKILFIKNRITELKNKGYKNIAIIAKDSKESEKIYNNIHSEGLNVELVSEELSKYNGGIIVIPSYLSKGLEFDNVIISGLNMYDDSNMDTKLLYVAFTRAMHTLDILN